MQAIPITPLDEWIGETIGLTREPLSRERLAIYQLDKLNRTLESAAACSRHYSAVFGGRPPRLASLDEITALPFTNAAQLSAEPLDFLCVKPDQVERIVTLPTSGTTGAPKRIYFSAPDQELTADFFHWGMSTLVDPGDRVLILLPGQLPGSVGDLLAIGLGRMGVAAIQHGPVTDPDHTLRIMHDEQATSLVGVPVQVLELAKRWAADSGRYGAIPLKTILLSTDNVSDAVVRVIEQTWGCQVFNHYGMTEMGLGGGVDCHARSGYHLREADLLFEVVDPESGLPVLDGDWGEVVFTTLSREAMPLIRYRTGDYGRFLPKPCECGTSLRRLAHIHGRMSGNVQLPSGARLSQDELDNALFALPEVVDFQLTIAPCANAFAILTLELRLIERATASLDNRYLQALGAIPAINENINMMSMSTQFASPPATTNPGTAKRRILIQEATA